MLKKLIEPKAETAVISPLNFQSVKVRIEGVPGSPLVMNKFSSKNREAMMAKQEQGSRAKKGEKRAPKDFDAIYRSAMHIMQDGSFGFPAPGLRSALISACRVVGFAMTRAKLSVFVEADGIDQEDGTPLVRIEGTPTRRDVAVRLADGGTDIIARPFFEQWSADVTLTWDSDQFSSSDILNLLTRAGLQVGLGAGRHDSKSSTGMGWGSFKVSASTQ
jgi:hypothetical protein